MFLSRLAGFVGRCRGGGASTLAVLVACVGSPEVALAQGQPEGTQPPPLQEQQVYDAKLARLQANAGDMPVQVDEVIQTTLGGFSLLPIDCPGTSAVTRVDVTIFTSLVAWDANLAVANSAGTYNWDCESTIDSGVKTLICNNWVMLDPGVTVPDEAGDDLDRLADEGLLYHELLHGQLLINAMLTDPAWRAAICNCNFDLGPSDADHSDVDPAVDGYLDARAAETANVTVVRPTPQTAERDGSFDFDLGPATKDSFTFNARFPSVGGNVDDLQVRIEDGRFRVSGRLVDRTETGRFYLRIGPPSEWIVAGIEEAVVVLPAASVLDIPALAPVGIAVLALLLALGALVGLRRVVG